MRQLAGAIGVAIALGGTTALAESRDLAGHAITVTEDRSGSNFLLVNDAMLHEDGLILLDLEPVLLDGLTVLTGVAGAGGNACNAAPIVLALPEGGAPEFWGPVESCAWLVPRVEGGRIIFAAEALPGSPGETWVWTRGTGFAPGPAVDFVASAGWDALETLAGAHPVNAFALEPVLGTLQAGLGADFPTFARLISGVGSGNLTAEGYLGSACEKPTCDSDWAILYLHRDTQGIFAIWQTYNDTGLNVWPTDRSLWPPEPLALLDWSAGD